jgi:hypothetical protein
MAEVDVQQWRLLEPGAELASARKVTLRNEVVDSSLRYGEREYGINLVWDQAADLAGVSFLRAAGAGGPVASGRASSLRDRPRRSRRQTSVAHQQDTCSYVPEAGSCSG